MTERINTILLSTFHTIKAAKKWGWFAGIVLSAKIYYNWLQRFL